MPFKSQAQRRKFAQLLVEGKISPATFEEWNRETGRARLPERASPSATKKKAAGTPKRATKRATPSASRRVTARTRTSASRRAAKKR
jgi:hypothetical protein